MEQNILEPLLFGLTAAIAWGIADFLAAKASKLYGAQITAICVSLISILCFGIYYSIDPSSDLWTGNGLLFATLAGISFEFGLLAFYLGLKKGPVSIVSPISSAYPVVSAILLALLFGASLSIGDMTGIAVVIVGVMIASGIFYSVKSEIKSTKGIMYGLATIVLWGIAYALIDQSITEIGWKKTTLVELSVGFVALSTLILTRSGLRFFKELRLDQLRNPYVLGAALIQLLGGVLLAIGLSRSESSAVIITLSATYPALTVILALVLLREKRQNIPLLGAFITIIGVVVLSM